MTTKSTNVHYKISTAVHKALKAKAKRLDIPAGNLVDKILKRELLKTSRKTATK